LLIGDGGEQQARVPLGADAGELVALEPTTIELEGMLSTSLVDLNVTSAELRADDPVNHKQVEKDKLALTIHFDAVSRKSGNWTIFPDEFLLDLPSGSSLSVDGALLGGLPGSDTGAETADRYVRFLVDDPPAGSYVLHFLPNERWQGEDDPSDITLELELE
jgi:hypothetical protein